MINIVNTAVWYVANLLRNPMSSYHKRKIFFLLYLYGNMDVN